MANAARRTVNYTPRYTEWEACELLPPQVRCALKDALTDWSSAACLRHTRKHGWQATVALIREGDAQFMSKWVAGRGKKKPEPSPCVVVGVEPLRANWCAS
jgi:hypothetical protein